MRFQRITTVDEKMNKTGILLTNLGTPQAPTPKAVRAFLAEFLADPRVIEVPRLLWWFILNGVILRIRPGKVAKIYQQVWTDKGSPLMVIAQSQATKLQAKLGEQYHVALGMRYGKPSLKQALLDIRKAGCDKVIVLPLYPQNSGSTTGSTFDATMRCFEKCRGVPPVRFINQYFDHPLYIQALAESVKQHWNQHGRKALLVMSFHGLPQRYVDKGDPYYNQCHSTAKLLAKALKLLDNEWQICFQSRVGREPWLKPYTDELLASLPTQDVNSVDVICPGFSADCIETLEEIDIQNHQIFKDAGGEQFSYIPALNDSDLHIEMMDKMIKSS